MLSEWLHNVLTRRYICTITDECGEDGFYYLTEQRYVICEGGYFAFQDCAPGSKSLPFDNYPGEGMYRDIVFCNVNLVDSGYTVLNQPSQDVRSLTSMEVPASAPGIISAPNLASDVVPAPIIAPDPAPAAVIVPGPAPVSPHAPISAPSSSPASVTVRASAPGLAPAQFPAPAFTLSQPPSSLPLSQQPVFRLKPMNAPSPSNGPSPINIMAPVNVVSVKAPLPTATNIPAPASAPLLARVRVPASVSAPVNALKLTPTAKRSSIHATKYWKAANPSSYTFYFLNNLKGRKIGEQVWGVPKAYLK